MFSGQDVRHELYLSTKFYKFQLQVGFLVNQNYICPSSNHQLEVNDGREWQFGVCKWKIVLCYESKAEKLKSVQGPMMKLDDNVQYSHKFCLIILQ